MRGRSAAKHADAELLTLIVADQQSVIEKHPYRSRGYLFLMLELPRPKQAIEKYIVSFHLNEVTSVAEFFKSNLLPL